MWDTVPGFGHSETIGLFGGGKKKGLRKNEKVRIEKWKRKERRGEIEKNKTFYRLHIWKVISIQFFYGCSKLICSFIYPTNDY